MASLQDIPMSSLLEEIISRSTNLAFIGNFVVNGEEHEMGILHGAPEKNFYNLALLQQDILAGNSNEIEEDGEDIPDDEDE